MACTVPRFKLEGRSGSASCGWYRCVSPAEPSSAPSTMSDCVNGRDQLFEVGRERKGSCVRPLGVRRGLGIHTCAFEGCLRADKRRHHDPTLATTPVRKAILTWLIRGVPQTPKRCCMRFNGVRAPVVRTRALTLAAPQLAKPGSDPGRSTFGLSHLKHAGEHGLPASSDACLLCWC
jgi:hypothetical protein